MRLIRKDALRRILSGWLDTSFRRAFLRRITIFPKLLNLFIKQLRFLQFFAILIFHGHTYLGYFTFPIYIHILISFYSFQLQHRFSLSMLLQTTFQLSSQLSGIILKMYSLVFSITMNPLSAIEHHSYFSFHLFCISRELPYHKCRNSSTASPRSAVPNSFRNFSSTFWKHLIICFSLINYLTNSINIDNH